MSRNNISSSAFLKLSEKSGQHNIKKDTKKVGFLGPEYCNFGPSEVIVLLFGIADGT